MASRAQIGACCPSPEPAPAPLLHTQFTMSGQFALPVHQHGKSKVRLGRTWREGNVHHFVEWNVHTMLESPMEHAFIKVSPVAAGKAQRCGPSSTHSPRAPCAFPQGDNAGMTATDTQKNTVWAWGSLG